MTGETAQRCFPWIRAMQIGFGELRLAPRDFWAMTPKELAMAAQALHGEPPHPLQRVELDRLISRYPDQGPNNGTD